MTSLLNNKYLSGFVSLLLALYAVYVAPALPNNVLRFFDTPIGRLFFIFLAAYLASEGNTQVALMVSIALTVSLMALEKKTIEESFLQQSSVPSNNSHLRYRNIENFDSNDGLGGQQDSDQDSLSMGNTTHQTTGDPPGNQTMNPPGASLNEIHHEEEDLPDQDHLIIPEEEDLPVHGGQFLDPTLESFAPYLPEQ